MRALAALGALLTLTVGVYWKLTLSDRYTWLENPDNSNLIRPWLDFRRASFKPAGCRYGIPIW